MKDSVATGYEVTNCNQVNTSHIKLSFLVSGDVQKPQKVDVLSQSLVCPFWDTVTVVQHEGEASHSLIVPHHCDSLDLDLSDVNRESVTSTDSNNKV